MFTLIIVKTEDASKALAAVRSAEVYCQEVNTGAEKVFSTGSTGNNINGKYISPTGVRYQVGGNMTIIGSKPKQESTEKQSTPKSTSKRTKHGAVTTTVDPTLITA